MYATSKLAPTLALMAFFTACGGSSAKKNVPDATPLTSDAGTTGDGRSLDTKVTTLDTAPSADTRDAKDVTDLRQTDVKEAGADGITSETGADTQKNPDGKVDAMDAIASLDAMDAPKPLDVRDGPKPLDTNKDNPQDLSEGDTPILPNSCTNPLVVPWPADKAHVDILVDTTTEAHDFTLPCGASGNDVVLKFNLPEASYIVYADTFGATWNTMLYFGATCPPASATDPLPGQNQCNDDACDGFQSQATALLAAGDHYLIVSGVGTEAGPVTVHLQRAEVSVTGMTTLPAGTGSMTGTNSGNGRTALCQASGPETSYGWISCPNYVGGAFVASTCEGATYDMVLALQIPRTDVALCANGDACGRQERISGAIPAGAGLNVLTVDGDINADQGPFIMTYTRP